MKKIGITGGIGSGKSTACEIFRLLGIPVFNADSEAKNIQNSDDKIKQLICNILGNDVYTTSGELDRKRVAEIVFNDPQALAAINSIIHPAVRSRFLKWSENYADVPYVLYEAAILFESGYSRDFDRTILILADEKIRISRVVKRDHVPEAIVKQRISNQMADSEKAKLADYIIDNNGGKLVIPQILKIDQLIREDGKIG